MAEDIPYIGFGLSAEGEAVVTVGAAEYQTHEALLDVAPYLLDSQHAALYAKAVNHFAHGFEYEVIEDPADFKEAYLAQLEQEKGGDWDQTIAQLSDYGTPDFDLIAPPSITGDDLVFFARDDYSGVPYRVTAKVSQSAIGAPDYEPMEMTPVPDSGGAAPADEETTGEPASESEDTPG